MQIDKKSLFICAAASLFQALPAHAIIEESGPTYTTYPLNTTTIPVLSATGSKSTDPTFGTEIMRLTDTSDGSTSCGISYSNIPVFNNDNTRLMVRCVYPSGPAKNLFYTFDSSTFTVSGYTQVPYLSGDATWAATEANIIYSRSEAGGGPGYWYGPVLNSYNLTNGDTAKIKDFRPHLPTGYGLDQMSRSMDDDIWAFTVVDNLPLPSGSLPTQKFVGFIVWKSNGNQILLNETYLNPNDPSEKVDQVQIDKTGRYLTVQGTAHHAQVWDLQAPGGPVKTQLVYGLNAYTHEDTGRGTVFSGCGTGPGICYRPLSRPETAPTILPFSNWNQANLHFTMLADNEGWGLATNAHFDPLVPYLVTLPFHGEIFQVATDGSGRVRRIVHTNTNPTIYPRQAFGNLSRDGRFVAWTSDWGGFPSGRTDVYLAKIDPAPNRPGPISGPLETLDMLTASADGTHSAIIHDDFNTPADASGFPTRSELRVFENSVELNRPHAAHADIGNLGDGRFSHWVDGSGIESLRFSATDTSTTTPASNPLSNGRTYRYNVPDRQLPLVTKDQYIDLPNVYPPPALGTPGSYACLLTVSLGHLADTATYRVQSTLRVFEDGVEMKPGHSLHADIRYLGGGRFSHQITGGTETLRLSASDNTNPCKNGRTYTYIIDSRLP